jgi:hypothetical protein
VLEAEQNFLEPYSHMSYTKNGVPGIYGNGESVAMSTRRRVRLFLDYGQYLPVGKREAISSIELSGELMLNLGYMHLYGAGSRTFSSMNSDLDGE